MAFTEIRCKVGYNLRPKSQRTLKTMGQIFNKYKNFLFIAIFKHLVYNEAMRQMVIICVIIFLIVWGFGVFFGYLASLKKIKLTAPQSEISGAAELQKQRRLVEDSQDLKRRTMQDYQYQIQRYKDTLKTNPTMGRF